MTNSLKRPGTWFSGKNKPGLLGGQDAAAAQEWWIKPALTLALVASFPGAAVGFLLIGVPLSRRYVRGRWMLLVTAVGLLMLRSQGGLAEVGPHIRASYRRLYDELQGETVSPAMAVAHFFGTHLPVDLTVGGLMLGSYLGFLNYRTPAWRKPEPKTTLIEWLRRRRNVAALEAAAIDSDSGAALGVDERTGHLVTVDDTSLARHCLVVGGVGSGKSSSSMRILGNRIRRGQPVIVADLKNSLDLPEFLQEMADRHGRPYYHWSLNGPLHYDPLRFGDPSRRKDLLIGSMEFGDGNSTIFKTVAEDYLQLAFKVADLAPSHLSTLEDITSLLDPAALANRLAPHAHARPDLWAQAREIVGDTDPVTRSGLRGLRLRLRNMATSVAGPYLSSPPIDPGTGRPRTDLLLDLRKAIGEGAVVCFSIDSSNYEEIASAVAGLLIQDLKTLSSQMRAAGNITPVQVFIDEFSSVDSVNLLGLLAKSRDAGMPVMLATQSLADLMRTEPQFVDQVLDIVGTFMIHRINTFEAADRLALLGGKIVEQKELRGVEEHNTLLAGGRSIGTATGSGRISEEEVYVINPSDVQQLATGQCFLIAKGKKAAEQSQQVRVVLERRLKSAQTLAKAAADGDGPKGCRTLPVQPALVADDPFQSSFLAGGVPEATADPELWQPTPPNIDPGHRTDALPSAAPTAGVEHWSATDNDDPGRPADLLPQDSRGRATP